MPAKFVFIVGVLGVGGYIGHKMANFDPTIFPYSQEQARTMLVGAKTILPRRDGDGKIQIWSPGSTTKGVMLNMQYASWAPLLKCEAVITAVAPDQSRVVPVCTSGPKSDSAISNTQEELRTPMFEEHIQSTLNKRAFNRDTVDSKEAATVMKNLGGMQREALKSADEAQRMAAESGR